MRSQTQTFGGNSPFTRIIRPWHRLDLPDEPLIIRPWLIPDAGKNIIPDGHPLAG